MAARKQLEVGVEPGKIVFLNLSAQLLIVVYACNGNTMVETLDGNDRKELLTEPGVYHVHYYTNTADYLRSQDRRTARPCQGDPLYCAGTHIVPDRQLPLTDAVEPDHVFDAAA